MTNDKAVKLLRRIADEQFDGEYGDERREALEMAVRALESNLVKESGDLVKDLVKDCISRQAAMVVFENSGLDDDSKDTVVRVLEQLPSAQPERKTGKWIEHNPHNWGLGIIYECSECGYEMDCEEPNFCPDCGADMRGENE